MRQAYDYWQDQPGNYFPSHPRGRFLHRRRHPEGHVSRWEFVKTTTISQDLATTPPRLSRLSTYSPFDFGAGHSISLYPRSHKSQGHLSPSGSDEDRTLQRGLPATGGALEARTITADPHVVDRIRFGHRQAIHISLRRRRTLQTSALGLTKASIARHTLLKPAPLAWQAQALTRWQVHQSSHSERGPTGRVKRDPFSTPFLPPHTHHRKDPHQKSTNLPIPHKGTREPKSYSAVSVTRTSHISDFACFPPFGDPRPSPRREYQPTDPLQGYSRTKVILCRFRDAYFTHF